MQVGRPCRYGLRSLLGVTVAGIGIAIAIAHCFAMIMMIQIDFVAVTVTIVVSAAIAIIILITEELRSAADRAVHVAAGLGWARRATLGVPLQYPR